MYSCDFQFIITDSQTTEIRHYAAGEVIDKEYFVVIIKNVDASISLYFSPEQMRKFRDDVHFGMMQIESEVEK